MKEKYKKITLAVLMSIVTSFVISSDRTLYLEGFKKIFFVFTNDILITSILLIIIFNIYLKYNSKKYDKKIKVISLIVGIVFSLIEVAGFYLLNTKSFFNHPMNLCTIVYNIIIFLGWLSIFYTILCLSFDFLLNHNIKLKSRKEYSFFTNNRKSFFAVAIFLILCWLSYYLLFYSGVVTNDSYYQIIQGIGYMPLTNEHPFLHTIIEGLIVRLGMKLFGTINSGIALCTFIQMCSIAFIISYTIKYLASKKINPIIRLIVLAFFALHPVIAMYSITLWKDVWMGIFNIAFIIILYEMSINIDKFLKSKKNIFLLCLNILLILFSKGTGILIIVAALIPMLFLYKKHIKKILTIFIASILVFYATNNIAQNVFDIKSGHIREPLSVPIQQISRTVKYHYDDLTTKEKKVLNEIFPLEKLGELYNPILSDDTKRELNEDKMKEKPLRYIKAWFKLGLKHPFTYIDSFLANSYGYWYPNTSYWLVFNIDYMNRLEYFKEAWPDVKYDEHYDDYVINNKHNGVKKNIVNMVNEGIRKIPVVSLLFSIGFYFWLDLIFLIIAFLKKEYKLLPIYCAILGTFLICIGSPVYAEFRYAYPAILTLPFIIIFTMKKIDNKKVS